MDRTEEAKLWRRWRAAAGGDASRASAPLDAMLLAAYAEGRLDDARAEAVERRLAADPEAIEDIAFARRMAQEMALPEAPAELVARAAALVAAPDPQVIPFRRPAPRAPLWRVAVAWGGVAASVLATSLIGFSMGSDAYANLLGGRSTSAAQELLDPPSGLFTSFEDPST